MHKKDSFSSTLLEQTRDFWNKNPCDGQSDIISRMQFRYNKEPWLPPLLEALSSHSNILEVGCGQGTDSLFVCQHMKASGNYIGIDYSNISVNKASANARQFIKKLSVKPKYLISNGEFLGFSSNYFNCVISIGVLHHIPNTQKAIDEIHRVLAPGCKAFIFLYRTISPKVLVAHFLRGISSFLDIICFKDHFLWKILQKTGSNHIFGTMFLECFGVPILKSYREKELKLMFSNFSKITIEPIGMGLPYIGFNNLFDSNRNVFGTLWKIVAEK